MRDIHSVCAEESLDLADRAGLAVIGETPACYLCFHDGAEAQAARLAACRRATRELIARDKNRACVLLWSLANEPEANAHLATHGVPVPPPEDERWKELGRAFFADVFALARQLDASRPLTLAAHPASDMSWVALCDVVCTNRYNGAPGTRRRGTAVSSDLLPLPPLQAGTTCRAGRTTARSSWARRWTRSTRRCAARSFCQSSAPTHSPARTRSRRRCGARNTRRR